MKKPSTWYLIACGLGLISAFCWILLGLWPVAIVMVTVAAIEFALAMKTYDL
jgi:hypothetical protein